MPQSLFAERAQRNRRSLNGNYFVALGEIRESRTRGLQIARQSGRTRHGKINSVRDSIRKFGEVLSIRWNLVTVKISALFLSCDGYLDSY